MLIMLIELFKTEERTKVMRYVGEGNKPCMFSKFDVIPKTVNALQCSRSTSVQASVPLMPGNGNEMKEMCVYWRTQADSVHGECLHPDGPRGQCVLSYADECIIREEPDALHTCAVCGNIMSSDSYEAKGCIFCGADAEPLVCSESYDVRDRE